MLLGTFLWIVRTKDRPFLTLILIALLMHKFMTVSLIQYEPRHMNAIYLFVYGGSMLGIAVIIKPFYQRLRDQIVGWRQSGVATGSG